MKYVALVPLRGGSKSIPGKNIRPLAGKPLALWTIEAASACPAIGAVYAATDDPRIKEVVESARLPKVTVVGRSAETATDTASTESVMLEFARAHEFENMVLIQATSPLTTVTDLSRGIEHHARSGADCLIAAVRGKAFLWRDAPGGLVEPWNYDPQRRPRRQDHAGYLVESGAFYISSRSSLLRTGCRIGGMTVAYEMPKESSYEIDDPTDLPILEGLLRLRAAQADDHRRRT